LPAQVEAIRIRYAERNEDFDLHELVPAKHIPESRYPSDGINLVFKRYHAIPSALTHPDEATHITADDKYFVETNDERSHIVYDDTIDLSGAPPHPEILKIITQWFPSYLPYLKEYCRPPSFGPQAFRDFNRPTPNPPPPSPQRHEDIMTIVRAKFNLQPYRPLHFVDALAADTPLSTSSSYYSKFDPETRIFARWSTPTLYLSRPTSKGYSFNVMLNLYRTEFHHVKYTSRPFPADLVPKELHESKMHEWFQRHPAQLFIRSQISKRDPSESKKIRPVYSVSDRFLHLEKTLTAPALAQLRNPECCVAHGLETFRGAMSYLDRAALAFRCFISLDWSQFDQRLPRYVITAFFLDYLPSLLIISHGYMPSRGYHDTTQPIASFAKRIFNTLRFLYIWYLSMTFLSFDGFAFIRRHGGVPSGLLNTQFLDSFGNMYIISDCLLEFGFSIAECLEMLFYVMGDDNLIYTQIEHSRIHAFMLFLEKYSESRHGMVLSVLKSVYSNLRTKISFLSYENNYGSPTRPIGKLVAQLALPERPIPEHRSWIHAARALGLAYASCGQNQSFHQLCRMVYESFKPKGSVPTHHLRKTFKKWQYQLPSEFALEENAEYTFPPFPTLHEIHQSVKDYHGSLSEHDKWNRNVFDVPPSDNLTDYVTLKEYILNSDPEMFSQVNEFWNGKRSY